jgi:hypothetical protein
MKHQLNVVFSMLSTELECSLGGVLLISLDIQDLLLIVHTEIVNILNRVVTI